MFVLVVVVEVEVGYNTIVHKTQPLKGSVFSFFDEFHAQNSTSITKTNIFIFFLFFKVFLFKIIFFNLFLILIYQNNLILINFN
jgi:hypothetical protein